ncbi:MAG TPA: twin-arginine translocase subunit TatC, partial [Anaerolineae bacterium]|nr:twin-arginine translocase subunit TatC [Anaerolineae bacterium]
PGLTKKERRYLWIVLPGVGISFVAGAAFAYFVMLPAAIPFLQGFLSDIVEQKWSIERYINLVTRLLFWVGLSFETPLILAFLARLGIVSPQKLVSWRRYALVIMALLAAIITPTVDPVNMLLVMAPLIVLYEIGVVLSRIAYRPRPGFSSEETE